MILRGVSFFPVLFFLLAAVILLPAPLAFSVSPADLNAEAVQHLADGVPQKALPKLIEAARALPYEPVIRRNLAECYLQLGLEMLGTRNYERAAGFFRQGKEHAAEDPRFWVYNGLAHMKAGDAGGAEAEFNEALALSDNDPHILFLLGELYYSTGELYRARQVLEEASARRPEDVRIADLLQRVNRELPVEERMVSTQGGNFSVACDGDLNENLGDEILDVLEDAYNELGSAFGYYPSVQVPVLVYSREVYDRLTSAPAWSGGVYDGKIRIPVGGITHLPPHLKALLYHEYSHVLVHFMARGRIPLWLNEGLAEVAGRRFFTPPVAEMPLPFIEWSRLEQTFEGLDEDLIRSAYYQSYLMVAYLIDRYGRHTLNDLVVEAARTGDIDLAVKGVYGHFQVDYQVLQAEWHAQAVDLHGLLQSIP